jgi:molybdenum cofactor synthesis domain-containing protein
VFAEAGFEGPLGPGEAVAIATGGRIPVGADTVVIFEETRNRGDRLSVPRYVRRGERVAYPGDDFRRGDLLVERGAVIGAAELGAMASAGVDTVPVYVRPRVAILPNGNELVAPGRRLGQGQIYESNNYTLSAVVAAAGGTPEPHPPLRDDPGEIERAIRRALLRSDLVVLTGGSSVGERDYLPAIFPRLGRVLFHGVAVRPGKPTLAVSTRRAVVLGMPGHPTSCLANGFWLLYPIVRKLARLTAPGWTDRRIRLSENYMPPSPDLATVIPLAIRGERGFPTFRDSAAITSLRSATAFAIVPPRGRLARGSRLVAHQLSHPLVASGTPTNTTKA